jgi:DNA polymerase-3 subunit beta
MKFVASSSNLLQHLLTVNGAIMSKPIIPILENFLFDIKGGELTIFSTDLETSMTTTMPVDAKEDMRVAVPSRLVIDTLRSLPEQQVAFNVDTNTYAIEVSTDQGRYKMAGQDASDFPNQPEKSGDASITLPSNVLLKAISKTLFAAGTDELRPNLTGLFVEMKTDHVNFVATDANKLVRFTRKDIQPQLDHGFIIPKKPLNLLKTALPNDETPVVVDYNQSNVFFSFGDTELICRLLDEKYPDYSAVIPTNNTNKLNMDIIYENILYNNKTLIFKFLIEEVKYDKIDIIESFNFFYEEGNIKMVRYLAKRKDIQKIKRMNETQIVNNFLKNVIPTN